MKWIHCNEKFNHGRDIYWKNEIRYVSDEYATLFVYNGWANEVNVINIDFVGPPEQAQTTSVDLDVHNGRIGLGDNYG